jgi:NADP-dependent 3-hydroxy acid dehydrogenase YdfG
MPVKVVLIFGAASGIGNACMLLFKELGWHVVGVDILFDKDIASDGLATTLFGDITQSNSVESVVEFVMNQFGKVNIVVNSVGAGHIGTLESMPTNDIYSSVGLNVFGTINIIKSVIPAFKFYKKGRFIQVSSMAGKAVYPLSSVYCASKYAIEGLLESLRFELINDGISVHIVRPGRTDSHFSQNIKEHDDNSEEQRFLINKVRHHFNSNVKNHIPPQFVAKKIYELATMESPPFSLPCDRLTDYIL